ncbi:ribonuclease H1-like [Maniola hyperantus]|uniref:ribonuclease H1-like n=1 Tax=Aphantopus hyperantus TaxID=2795564 RepID=UPI00156A0858|nr:ribonuclease H1-like [Maniola hyperantus]
MIWKIINPQRFIRRIKTEILLQGLKIPNMSFYAVAKGRTSGIFGSWADCESQVKGFSGARYKKFNTVTEAQDFINTYGENKSQKKIASNTHNGISLPSRSSASNGPSNTLKRPFSTSNLNNSDEGPSKPKKKSTKSRRASYDSIDSDDLNTIIVKQMDDIEKRLKGFEKGVDKIIEKSVKSDRKAIMIEPQSLSKTNGSNNFKTDSNGYVHVYTDGACSANGKKGAKAGLGVYWGEGHPLNVSEPVSGRATNNCGEIQAATRAIQQAIDNGVDKLAINTDSQFLINSVTKWIHGWKRKGWKLQSGEPVKNEKDFKDLDRIQDKILIRWNYVEAHKGIHGNERADQLAKAGAAMYTN